MSHPDARPIGTIDLMVFVVELALLAALAVAGVRLGSQAMAIVLPVLLPVIATILWGLWLAPRAARRLPYGRRIVAKLALIVLASTLLASTDAAAAALSFLVICGSLITIGELRPWSRPRPVAQLMIRQTTRSHLPTP